MAVHPVKYLPAIFALNTVLMSGLMIIIRNITVLTGRYVTIDPCQGTSVQGLLPAFFVVLDNKYYISYFLKPIVQYVCMYIF